MDTREPKTNKRLLNPIDRISEILFGLIMALTFTCTISVFESDRAVVKDMLIGAIGCNIAWGLVDAVMHILMTMTEKRRSLTIFNFVRKTDNKEKAHQFISDALPPVIASVMKQNDLEEIRKKIIETPYAPPKNRLKIEDFKTAFGIFTLVFLSTFPIAIPFIFIHDLQTALRVSNAIAIFMMFLCGWGLGQYSRGNRFFMGTLMSLIGVALVLITIALGG